MKDRKIEKSSFDVDDLGGCPACGCGECTWVEDISGETRKNYLEAIEMCNKLLADKYDIIRHFEKGCFSRVEILKKDKEK